MEKGWTDWEGHSLGLLLWRLLGTSAWLCSSSGSLRETQSPGPPVPKGAVSGAGFRVPPWRVLGVHGQPSPCLRIQHHGQFPGAFTPGHRLHAAGVGLHVPDSYCLQRRRGQAQQSHVDMLSLVQVQSHRSQCANGTAGRDPLQNVTRARCELWAAVPLPAQAQAVCCPVPLSLGALCLHRGDRHSTGTK